MDIKPIKTDTDYRAALKKAEGLMTAAADTLAGERLDVLVTLVEAWERRHYPMNLPDRSRPSSSRWSAGAHGQGSGTPHRPLELGRHHQHCTNERVNLSYAAQEKD
ncbi:MAG: hypothetical protein WCA45_11610 [Thiobacillaceae bacterium]